MNEVVAVDVGGTHARFAIATIDGGRVARMEAPVTLKTADHASLQGAWQAFAAGLGRRMPRAAAIAVPGPVEGEVLTLANMPWIIRPALIRESLKVDEFVLVNDFGAVAHAVAICGEGDFLPLCGPDRPIGGEGVVAIVGPGTGLGVAQLVRRGGRAHVVETEGGHIDFAPLDALDDAILARLRARHGRVSVERIVSGPGLRTLCDALAGIEGAAAPAGDDAALWASALTGEDSLTAAALDRLCLSLGAVAGDIALAQGASAVVIAGGVGLRLAGHLPRSGFARRFAAKGRFAARMAAMPVKLMTCPNPGLLGAAAAFAGRE